MIKLYISIFLISVILSKPKYSYLTITEGNTFLKKLDINLINNNTKDFSLGIEAKICYLYTFSNLFDCLEFEGVYNNKWILFLDDLSVFKNLLIWEYTNYDKLPSSILAHIIPESIKEYMPSDLRNYIFYIRDRDYEVLKDYNIINEDSNYFINLYYDDKTRIFPFKYLYYTSLFLLIISSGAAFLWYIMVYKIYINHITSLQKVLTSLPLVKFILGLLIYYYVDISRDEETEEGKDTLMKVYLDTIITTLMSIFKTVLWFLIIMLASGWQIYKSVLSREEMRKFIILYIFIYLAVCFDQVLDLMSQNPIGPFQASDVKNFVIYTLLSLLVVFKSNSTYKLLRNRYVYASLLSRQYIPALKMKMSIIKLHSLNTILFCLSYILVVTIQKILFKEYSHLLVTLIHSHGIDLIFLIFYLIIYRPRKFPEFFDVNYSTSDEVEMEINTKIYMIKLPLIKNLSNSVDFDTFINKDKCKIEKTSNDLPFLIINPIFPDEIDNLRKSINSEISSKQINITDKMSIAYKTLK